MSDERDRIKRPQPERVQPFRSWSTLLTGAAPRVRAEPRNDGASSGEQTSAPHADPPDPPSFNDVVARSVDIGYRVIDEYVRQGQKAAQRFSDRSFGPDAVVNDMREVADRMAQHASDVLGLWFQFLEMVSANAIFRPTGGAADPARGFAAAADAARAFVAPFGAAPAASGATRGAAPRVRVEVTSPYPTEVSVELRPDAGPGPYIVHALRTADGATPRLTEVALLAAAAGSDDGPRFRIRVPPDQPAGTYNGLIIDEASSRPVGAASVRIARE